MDFLTRDDLETLVGYSDGPCVSIYLPTHRAGVETLQDPIRLKNLLRKADQDLQGLGQSGHALPALLRPARELLENYEFWQHQSDGLALFLAKDFLRTFRLQLQVPELAIVAEHFHVKPLLADITVNSHFYVLALSQNRTRLFRGTQASLAELAVQDMPGSMSDWSQEEPLERQLQSHSAGNGHGYRTAVIHGQGGQNRKEELVAYFHEIDLAVRKQLPYHPGPLILAGVDYLYPLYHRASSITALLDTWISGNPDAMPLHELHKRALAIASAHFSQAQKEACDRYLALWHTQRASNKLSDILPAALHGRIESLLVAVGVQTWGRLDATTSEAVISESPGAGDEDLLNLAAIHTCISGGTVHAVQPEEVPGGGDVAAVFRY
jgi:release factor family 3